MPVAEIHHTDRERPLLRAGRTVAAPALLFLLVVGVYWKLVLTDEFTWLESPDLAYQVLPWWQFQAGEWKQGRIPLWDPYHWNGQPLIGQAQPGVAYPLNWIFFLLPLKSGWIQQGYLHWYYVVIHFLAAWFCYLLCRDLDRSRAASLLGACAFAFGGFVMANDWPQMLNGGIWTPLIFLFLFRVWRGSRPLPSATAAGFFLGLAWLSGHHQAPTFVTLGAAGFWLYLLIENRRRWLPALAFGLCWIFTSALQTLPAYEYGKLARRWVGLADPVGWTDKVPYSIHTQYSLAPRSLIGLLVPDVFQGTDPYMGPLTLAFAALGLTLAATRREVRALALMAGGGLLLALGGNSLLHGFLYAWAPLVEKARSPHMAMVLFSFGMAALTAYGFDCLAGRSRVPRWLPAGLFAFTALVFATAVVLALTGRALGDDRILVVALLAAATAVLLIFAHHLQPKAAAAGALTLMVLQAGVVIGHKWPSRYVEERNHFLRPMSQHGDIAHFLHSRPQPFRVDVSDDDVPYNFGAWHGIEQIRGYLASLTENTTAFELHEAHTQRLANTVFYVAKTPRWPTQQVVFESSSGLKVFENADPLPHARFVHQAAEVHSLHEFRVFIGDPRNDLRRVAVFREKPPKLEPCANPDNNEVRWLRRLPMHSELRVRTACSGLLVIADTWFPGWEAKIDGQRAEILRPYGAFRGLMVNSGIHTISLEYRPYSVLAGGIMTALGFLAAAAALWPRRHVPEGPH